MLSLHVPGFVCQFPALETSAQAAQLLLRAQPPSVSTFSACSSEDRLRTFSGEGLFLPDVCLELKNKENWKNLVRQVPL